MSVQSEITRLASAKAGLSTWLTDNGVTVPAGAKLDALVGLLDSVEAGGGGIPELSGHDVICGSFCFTVDNNGASLNYTYINDSRIKANTAYIVFMFVLEPIRADYDYFPQNTIAWSISKRRSTNNHQNMMYSGSMNRYGSYTTSSVCGLEKVYDQNNLILYLSSTAIARAGFTYHYIAIEET